MTTLNEEMKKHGWEMIHTTQPIEKWVLENTNIHYRDFLYGAHKGFALIQNLRIAVETKKVRISFRLLGMEGAGLVG